MILANIDMQRLPVFPVLIGGKSAGSTRLARRHHLVTIANCFPTSPDFDKWRLAFLAFCAALFSAAGYAATPAAGPGFSKALTL
jgi:hypothetical protein